MTEQQNIPKHWEIKKLGEVCEVLDNLRKPINSSERQKRILGKTQNELFPYYGATGQVGWIDNYITDGTYILIGEDGAPFLDIFKDKAYKVSGKTWVNNHAHIIKGKQNIIIDDFALHYLNSINYRKFVNGTTRLKLTKSSLIDIPFILPPIAEQQAIVAKIEELLSDLENGKQQLLKAQQQLKVYRQSLLKWAFEGKLTKNWRKKQIDLPSFEKLINNLREEKKETCTSNNIKIKPIAPITEDEFYELPVVPNTMTWVRLGDLLWSVKDGPHYSPKYQEEGIPFISGGNIRPNGIDFRNVKYISLELHEELSRRCKPEKFDILYTKGGTTGIAKVNDYDLDFNVWVHVAVLKALPSINPYYLQYVLNSNHCYKQSQKYTHGVGNQDLGLTRMILITVPICSPAEQQQIVEILESKLTVCDKLEETISQSLAQAETLRQSILKKAFEGKLL